MISKITNMNEVAEGPEAQAINAIRLTSLKNLAPGWNQFNEDLWALETYGPRCIDTTLCPAPRLMWLHTVLVEY